jgi:3-dehydroquinate dehydratase-2
VKNRVEVMHGVNLDQLGVRDPAVYGSQTLTELEVRVKRFATELGLETTFSQTNHEGEFCEALHEARTTRDGLILNPGAWTHYSYAIRDALEVTGLPAVEVHISDIEAREDWRRRSVIGDLCIGAVHGRGVDGYREALEMLRNALRGRS